MKTYVQPGHTITLAAPYDVASGDGLLVGSVFGIASADAAESAPVATLVTGVVDLKKAASQAWAVGAKVYWDDTAKVATTTATDNTLIGVAVQAVGDGADETVGRVRLNGAFV
jgi:predicted RecA/RadA family phage recombinase